MSVAEPADHWTDFLEPQEAIALDALELQILANKEELAELRKTHRAMFEKGTSRRRRAK